MCFKPPSSIPPKRLFFTFQRRTHSKAGCGDETVTTQEPILGTAPGGRTRLPGRHFLDSPLELFAKHGLPVPTRTTVLGAESMTESITNKRSQFDVASRRGGGAKRNSHIDLGCQDGPSTRASCSEWDAPRSYVIRMPLHCDPYLLLAIGTALKIHPSRGFWHWKKTWKEAYTNLVLAMTERWYFLLKLYS